MKTLQWILCLTIGLMLISCGSDADNETNNDNPESEQVQNENNDTENEPEIDPQDRLLGVKAVKITYQYSGDWTGTETAWVDNYGDLVVLEFDINYSEKSRQKSRIIWNGTESMVCQYLDFGEPDNTCQTSPLRVKDTEMSILSHGDESVLKYAYDPIGTKTIAGKEANGWQSKVADVNGYVWKGIDLAYNNMGVIKEALSVEEIDAIPEEMLGMPEGFTMK